MSPSGNRGTWTALGQTEAITFSDNGNAVVLKEVKGQTEFRGTEVPPGVFKGIVSQESTSGGCFRLEEKKAIEHSLPPWRGSVECAPQQSRSARMGLTKCPPRAPMRGNAGLQTAGQGVVQPSTEPASVDWDRTPVDERLQEEHGDNADDALRELLEDAGVPGTGW